MKKRQLGIILLAYVHRYIYLILIMFITVNVDRQYTLLFMGCGVVIYALWSFIGYLYRWKHIYCSYQDAYRQEMTPHRISWNKVKKSDAYGVPLIFLIMGIVTLVYYFIEL